MRLLLGMALGAMGAASVLAAGPSPARAEPTVIAEAKYPEGAVIIDGALHYAEMTADRVTRLDGDMQTVFEMPEGCGPTSVSPIAEGAIVVTCHLSGGLKVLAHDGTLVRTISMGEEGRPLTYPNDSHSDRRGGVYFSSSGPFTPAAQPAGRIFHMRPDGTVRLVAEGIVYSNGVFVTEDGILYVSEHLGHRILRYRIEEDGTLTGLDTFAGHEALGLPAPPQDALTGPDGIEVMADGRVVVAIYGAGKALILSPQGAVTGEIAVPMTFLTNIALDEAAGRAFLVGAFSNTDWPYDGEVIEVALPESQ